MLKPRPYQQEALDALDAHLRSDHKTAPCISIPTGGGKSLIIALAIQRWKANHPSLRVCVLAHRKELVQQNSDELRNIDPHCDLGVYAAGLQRRETENSILYASIDSIYKKAGELTPFDVILVDEAHRIPLRGDGKYRQFINECRRFNPKLVVVGFTATPYRMNGPICHRDHILQKLVYEADITQLINDGFLCMLRTKRSEHQPDLSKVRKAGGDYVTKSLSEEVGKSDTVALAVRELVATINAENRRSVVVFAIDIDHCKLISEELHKYGIQAPYVTAKTPARERDRKVEDFKLGRYRVLLNVNVYTEGFNAKSVDCVALLRPTLSKGMYIQMVGRGLRLHPNKTDCLVLDFANCIQEHGPINQPVDSEVRLHKCADCGDTFSYLVGKCPHCGWEIPPAERRVAEAAERVRRLHNVSADDRSILSQGEQGTWLKVNSVICHRHRKPGKIDSLRVQYRCGRKTVSEWICLDHQGYALARAMDWWNKRGLGPLPSVDEATQNMFLGQAIAARTRRIAVKREGKFWSITDYDLQLLQS